MASCGTILEEDRDHELQVTFHPHLYLQRKIWVLNVLRREGFVDIVDIGCGEGELLNALSQPAPWLGPPPSDIVPPPPSEPDTLLSPTVPNFNSPDEPIPNLHPIKIAGLDISENDLRFAVKSTAPRSEPDSPYAVPSIRWEPLTATIWKGDLQVINEDFVDTECIVSTEVIEHLPPDVFPFYAPILLGVYHPYKLLVTTPSYTFNARFTSPNAPASVRKGWLDPTGRTDRIFRHDDHKFEWTVAEFEEWCISSAEKWGYSVKTSSVGRPIEEDEWGRDDVLGGASLVAEFTRLAVGKEERKKLEANARQSVIDLKPVGEPHERLAIHEHPVHPSARHPASFEEIGDRVKEFMEERRESFLGFEEAWYETDISTMCGGWTEVLAKAVEMHEDLALMHDEGARSSDRYAWSIEFVGSPAQPHTLWPTAGDMGDDSFDSMPPDWMPEEEPYSDSDSDVLEGSSRDWAGSAAGSEGDFSWNNDKLEEPVPEFPQANPWAKGDEDADGWKVREGEWGVDDGAWGDHEPGWNVAVKSEAVLTDDSESTILGV